MAAPAWAKFPSAWMIRLPDDMDCPLIELSWRKHGTQGTAALIILVALSIRLNLSHRSVRVVDRKATVAVTYDELRDMTGFAKATISKALMLLQGMNAITIDRQGRANIYSLPDTETNGHYCQVPQDYLLNGKELELRRLLKLPVHTSTCLNAMKLYVLFMAFRNMRFNTTSISYEGIMKYTGMRRADIPEAFSLLVAHELARADDESDSRENDNSKRYRIRGLYPMHGGSGASYDD